MQISVSLVLDGLPPLLCQRVEGREALGEISSLRVECIAEQPLELSELLDAAALLHIQNDSSERLIAGVVSRIARLGGTRQGAPAGRQGAGVSGYRYRVTLESALGRLQHTTQCRVFQDLTLLEIAQQVLVSSGWDPSRIQSRCLQSYAPIDYVVQYDETDWSFLRRICERGGFFTHGNVSDGAQAYELCAFSDTTSARLPERPALQVAETGQEELEADRARRVAFRTQLCPGK